MNLIPSLAAPAALRPAVAWCARHVGALAICTLAFAAYATYDVLRYLRLAYTDWDMAFTNQAVWKLAHGEFFSTLFGFHVFGAHTELIHWLVAPLVRAIPHPLTYPLLAVFLFALSAGFLYKNAERKLGRFAAALACLAYCVFPANFFALTHDYTVEILSPLFIVAAFHFFETRHWRGFVIACALLCLVKESMMLIVIMFGVLGLMRGGERVRWGVVPLLTGTVLFVLAVKFLIPHFLGASHSLWLRYGQFGATSTEIIQALLNPLTWARLVALPENLAYLGSLFGVMILPALLAPDVLLLALPIVMIHLASNNAAEKTIYYHYAISITPILFLAAVTGLSRLTRRPAVYSGVMAACLVGACAGFAAHAGTLRLRWTMLDDPSAAAKWALVRMIPPQAGVIASFEFLVPLSMRSELYSLHKVYHRDFQDPAYMRLSEFAVTRPFVTPPGVRYALINSGDSLLASTWLADREFVDQRLAGFFADWLPVAKVGATTLYRRRE